MDIDGTGRKSLLKATEKTDQGAVITWKESKIEIKAGDQFVVIFSADNRNETGTSNIGLDDVKILPGSCKDQKSLKKSSPPGKICFFSSFLCESNLCF